VILLSSSLLILHLEFKNKRKRKKLIANLMCLIYNKIMCILIDLVKVGTAEEQKACFEHSKQSTNQFPWHDVVSLAEAKC